MTDQFALENNQRLKTIMNMAANNDGKVEFDSTSKPPQSQYEFTAVLKGPIDEIITGRVRLFQQELLKHFGAKASIISARDENHSLRVTFTPDVIAFSDEPNAMHIALNEIHDEFEDYILRIEYKTPQGRANVMQPICV